MSGFQLGRGRLLRSACQFETVALETIRSTYILNNQNSIAWDEQREKSDGCPIRKGLFWPRGDPCLSRELTVPGGKKFGDFLRRRYVLASREGILFQKRKELKLSKRKREVREKSKL